MRFFPVSNIDNVSTKKQKQKNHRRPVNEPAGWKEKWKIG